MPLRSIRGFRRVIVIAPAALALAVVALFAFQHPHDLTRAATLLISFRPVAHEADLAAIETALAQNDVTGAAARLRPLSDSLASLMVLRRDPGGQAARAFLARYRKAYQETSQRYERLVHPDDLTTGPLAGSSAAHLGDSLDRFIARFGEPIVDPGVPRSRDAAAFLPCPGGPLRPRLYVRLEDDRVVSIVRNSCFARGLDAQTSASEAAGFMPSDATPPHLRTGPMATAESGKSEFLAAAFSASSVSPCHPYDAPGRLEYSAEGYGWTLSVRTCAHRFACG